MKINQLTSLALAVALCLAQGAVWAKSGHGKDKDRNDRDCGRQQGQCERYDDHGRKGKHDNKDRFANGHDNRHHDGERGAGPDHSFYRGERLPTYYRAPRYVVNNYYVHGLRTPPRGYHWVQTGGDYVLVAIATGIILELLLNR